MSDQDNGQVSILQRPISGDPEAWKSYWKVQGWSWRTEPEIDAERQKYLAERRAIVPNIEKGIYPFKDVEPKLTRADIEWLLVTHENGRGPVDWNDERQRERLGLDLRGADLRFKNLSNLPLAAIIGGLTSHDWIKATTKEREMAAVDLKRAVLRLVHLEGAKLKRAHLERTDLYAANLQDTDLMMVKLTGSYLIEAHLENAYLRSARLDSINLMKAHLDGANLRFALFNALTNLDMTTLGNEKLGSAYVADARWENVNLSMIDWKQIKKLGDESYATQSKKGGKEKQAGERLKDYETAVRANRQIAVVLQGQGMNEQAGYFAYRAQKLQRIVLRRERKFGQYLFSLFLDALAGYGYRPGRSVLWYLATILVFALAYHFLGGLTLYPPDAFVFSIMSFHGRGFFPALSQETNLHNPLVMLAALEAIIGLLIEISFIATFTQRFFGR